MVIRYAANFNSVCVKYYSKICGTPWGKEITYKVRDWVWVLERSFTAFLWGLLLAFQTRSENSRTFVSGTA